MFKLEKLELENLDKKELNFNSYSEIINSLEKVHKFADIGIETKENNKARSITIINENPEVKMDI